MRWARKRKSNGQGNELRGTETRVPPRSLAAAVCGRIAARVGQVLLSPRLRSLSGHARRVPRGRSISQRGNILAGIPEIRLLPGRSVSGAGRPPGFKIAAGRLPRERRISCQGHCPASSADDRNLASLDRGQRPTSGVARGREPILPPLALSRTMVAPQNCFYRIACPGNSGVAILYFRLASDSESRERFLRLRFRASAAFTRIFCPGFK